MTIANLITLLRIVLVPVIIWALLSDQMLMAFLMFLLAGVSDAVDGTVARYFDQQTELGTVLDPIADKLMLVSVFIILAMLEHIPLWLVILIVSRDLLIILGVTLAFLLSFEFTIKPLRVSKATTLLQILLAAWILSSLAFEFDFNGIKSALEWTTGLLTGLSAVAYIWEGIKLIATDEATTQNEVVPGVVDEEPKG